MIYHIACSGAGGIQPKCAIKFNQKIIKTYNYTINQSNNKIGFVWQKRIDL